MMLRAIHFRFLMKGMMTFKRFLFEGLKWRRFVYIHVRKNCACGLHVIWVESRVARSISFKGSRCSDGDDDAVERALGFGNSV